MISVFCIILRRALPSVVIINTQKSFLFFPLVSFFGGDKPFQWLVILAYPLTQPKCGERKVASVTIFLWEKS